MRGDAITVLLFPVGRVPTAVKILPDEDATFLSALRQLVGAGAEADVRATVVSRGMLLWAREHAMIGGDTLPINRAVVLVDAEGIKVVGVRGDFVFTQLDLTREPSGLTALTPSTVAAYQRLFQREDATAQARMAELRARHLELRG